MQKFLMLGLFITSVSFASDLKVGNYVKIAFGGSCNSKVIKVNPSGTIDTQNNQYKTIEKNLDPKKFSFVACKPSPQELKPAYEEPNPKDRVNKGF